MKVSFYTIISRFTTIRGKIMANTLLLITIMGAWITWQSYNMTTALLQDQLEMRGVSLARDVAARSVDYVFTNNLYELHQLMLDTLTNNEDVAYLFLVGSRGEILVYSFNFGNIPAGLLNMNHVSGEERFNLITFQSEKGLIHDIAVPIFEGKAGTVRLGLAETQLRKMVGEVVRSLQLAIVTVFGVGAIAAYLLAIIISAPILQIIEGTRAVAAGKFDAHVETESRDELGQLVDYFNKMTEKLRQYSEENFLARAELERKEKMRMQLVEKLIRAQEDERKRIARELHDETSQSLTSMKLGLRVIEEEKDLDKVRNVSAELRETLGQTLEVVSGLARDLRPSVLDDMGLKAALTRYINNCSNRLGLRIGLHTEGLDECRFPSYLETAVYRIVQESLTNVMKYANAENVSVVVRYDGELLTAIVEDDGTGFSMDEILSGKDNTGLGIFGMQERAVFVGGALEIESAPGKGTAVYLKIPWKGPTDTLW